jgi:hypothetical protein
MRLFTLQLFKNGTDTQEKLRLNLHSLSASELLEYGRKSPSQTCKIAPSFLHRNPDNSTCSFGLKKLYYYNHLSRYCLTAGLYKAIHTTQVLDTSAHMKQDIV